ncbi:MFS transporter [Sphingomonas desiccabilis]|uniref:Multidrug efflux pump Tap n=1 Tax=Sphingomonas desiccabilis TaxID=429134 RepID=A0A4Q2J0F6_9SPHN|nr:MFS transporter [Sphingomonas desiccabilis]MBB3910344.1 MFS family permease [Sphingomonas desiccabilis]RXZ35004.1 MFS transporter [Sphingomonas desiccabilis]
MAAAQHPFAIHNFRAYFLARLSTTLAQMSMVIVIGWQVYDLARRTMDVKEAAFYLGLIGVAQFLPLLALSLVAGWVADRVDRRWIARGSVAIEAGCAITLAVASYHEHVTLELLFFVAALLGVARAFAGPSLQALAPNLVPKAILPTAIAMSSVSWQAGTVLGPTMGGYLYAANHWLPYTVSGALFSFSFLMLSLIGRVPHNSVRGTANPFRQMLEGLSYVRQNRLVLGAISLDLFAVLLGGATAMLPVYARDILKVGADGLGHLRAAPAVGAIAVALWFSWRPLRTNVGVKMLAAVAVFGGATVAFGLSAPALLPLLGQSAVGHDGAPAVLLALAALFVLGAADMVSVYVRQSLIQLYTPDDMRGRVGAVSTLFISGSNELGEAESGFLAAAIGPVAAVVAGGIGAILVTALWARIFPELRRARTFEAPATLEFTPVKEKAE